ncbi:MAG: hypothetical protein AB7E08_00065 [Candidatus Omnitrophota bacterium]
MKTRKKWISKFGFIGILCYFILLPSLVVTPVVNPTSSLRRVRRAFELEFLAQVVQSWQRIEQARESYPGERSDRKFDLLAGVLDGYLGGKLTSDGIQSGLQNGGVPQELSDFLIFLLVNSNNTNLKSLVQEIRGYRDGNAQTIGLIKLQKQMLDAQNNAPTFADYVTPQANHLRFERMQQAFPLSKDLLDLAKGNSGIPFISKYLYELYLRAYTVSDENVLYMVKDKNVQVAVIPFGALKFLRGGEMGFEYRDDGTMRQYIAFHTGRANFYGLAITEAENRPHKPQNAHNHGGFEEETIFLSDNVLIHSATTEKYNFGYKSLAPIDDQTKEGINHQLENPNDYPTADFTLKNPQGQLSKGTGGPKGIMERKEPVKDVRNWGEIYTQVYEKYHGWIPTAVELDAGGFVVFDAEGRIVEKDPLPLQAQIVVVKPGKTTETMPFIPLNDDTQVIRIFPWPKNMPEGTTQWLSEDNIAKIKGKVIIHYEGGGTVTLNFNGGDVIVLNNDGNTLPAGAEVSGDISGRITGYEIKNESEDNLELMFLTVISPR